MSESNKWAAKIVLVCTVLGPIIGFLSWSTSREGTDVTRQARERETGHSVANFEVKCDTSHLLVIADKPIEPKSIQIELKNNGPEPIKAIRCDISTRISWAADKAEDQKITPERFEFEFNEILRAGESGRVEILPAVVAYMKTLNPPPGKQTFWAPCTVACSVQIVGDSYFTSGPKLRIGDGDAASHSVSFGMTWKASDKVQMETLNFGISR